MRSDNVQHVIRRLKARGAIELKPFIDVSRLGQVNIAVFFSVALTKRTALATLLRNIIQYPRVTFLQSLAGDYHFYAALDCPTLGEIHDFLRKLSTWAGGAIISKSVVPRTKYIQYRRKYLTGVKKKEEALIALDSKDRIEISADERILLGALVKPAMESIRQVARDLRLPFSTVDYRYQQLLKKQVIRGWFYDVADEFTGTQRFKALITCRYLASDFEEKFEQFLRYHPHVTYLLQTIGEWDFEIGVECFRPEDMMNFITLTHETFPTEVSHITSVTELTNLKFVMFS
jgi:DNA-binding Lrp family transcriptional regulator